MNMDESTPAEHQTQRNANAIREYAAPGITVTWEASRCQHAAECIRGLPQVFDRDARPWINSAGADADEVVAVINRCPSYALGYRADDGRVRAARPSMPVTVLCEAQYLSPPRPSRCGNGP